MKNKIVLITGAGGGMGKATAFSLAKMGATVILHDRNSENVQKVKIELMDSTGNTSIDTVTADLLSLAHIRKMIETIRQKYDHLDVLVNNAGAVFGKDRCSSKDQIECTLALNLLAPFVLIGGLFDLLSKSDSARIVNVASSAHKENAVPDFTNFEDPEHYSPLKAYGDSKLFLILVSQYIDSKLKANMINNIAINTLHPGATRSNFSMNSNLGWGLNIMNKIARLFFKTPEQGAQTAIFLASSPRVKGASGQYYINCRPAKVGRKYDTVQNEEIVWNYCVAKSGISFLD